MKKIKFDAIDVEILISLIERKLEKLNERGVDEFTLDCQQLSDKASSLMRIV